MRPHDAQVAATVIVVLVALHIVHVHALLSDLRRIRLLY